MYALLVYFSDRQSIRWLFDIYVYVIHFTLFTAFGWFNAVLDNHWKYVIENQISYEQIAETQKNVKKLKVHYKILHTIQIVFLLLSVYLFSEVEIARLYCLYTPGLRILLQCLISYEEKFAKYKEAANINEKQFTNSLNYWFTLKTISFLLLSGTYTLIFTKTGLSITFSIVHLFYMKNNFKFVIVWFKEFEKFKLFHKYKKLITKKFPLKVLENQKEEWSIWLTSLINARELSWGHCFHLIWLLQMARNGDKKCPIWRRGFDEDRNQPEGEQPQNNNQQRMGVFNLQRVNQMNFYGLEDD